MYKGNMRDFVEKLDLYLAKNYGCKLIFIAMKDNLYRSNSKTTGDGKGTIFLICFFAKNQGANVAYEVYDRENFEDQVIDYVKKKMEENGIQR